jgi:carboxypeptidase Q
VSLSCASLGDVVDRAAARIASPNFGYFIYDGDGSAFNESGPAGSDHIEKLFEDYFDEVGLPTEPTEFDGRSDYGPFLDAGIPSGGLATGAEGIKTEAEAAL